MNMTTSAFHPTLHVDLEASTRTPSGLYYRDIQLGTGAAATTGQTVQVRYAGWLPTGRQFDSTGVRPPFRFSLGAGRVIRGWDEGVAGMRIGGSRQLIIPPELGYGAEGVGPIPPGAILVFDVELVAIE